MAGSRATVGERLWLISTFGCWLSTSRHLPFGWPHCLRHLWVYPRDAPGGGEVKAYLVMDCRFSKAIDTTAIIVTSGSGWRSASLLDQWTQCRFDATVRLLLGIASYRGITVWDVEKLPAGNRPHSTFGHRVFDVVSTGMHVGTILSVVFEPF